MGTKLSYVSERNDERSWVGKTIGGVFMDIKVLLVLVVFIAVGGIVACSKKTNKIKTGTHYYKEHYAYSVPFKPKKEVSYEETKQLAAYCIVEYNSKGQIIKFSKILNKELFFVVEYSYWDNGKVKEERGVNADGEHRVIRFSERGKVISDTLQ